MKTEEEIKDQINMYKHFVKEWREENEVFYWYEIKISERIVQELEWILEVAS